MFKCVFNKFKIVVCLFQNFINCTGLFHNNNACDQVKINQQYKLMRNEMMEDVCD